MRLTAFYHFNSGRVRCVCVVFRIDNQRCIGCTNVAISTLIRFACVGEEVHYVSDEKLTSSTSYLSWVGGNCPLYSNHVQLKSSLEVGDRVLCKCSIYGYFLQVDSWIDFCAHELELPATIWYYPVIGYMPYNAAAVTKAKEDLKIALGALEKTLLHRTYLVSAIKFD